VWRCVQCAICLVAAAAVSHLHAQESRPAEPTVLAANQAVRALLPFSDREDFEDATRGFIATADDPSGPNRYAFLNGDAPPTVNPSLWRHAQLNVPNGLFKVVDRIYQVRGFSVSNMTIVEGNTGLILIDTLATPAAARAALDLYFAHRPRKPVVAVIYTHSHPDHYGGISGVVLSADVAAGRTKVIAPPGFMEALVEETAFAANLTARRGEFQFGAPLPIGDKGFIDYGEGKAVVVVPGGSGPIIAPTETVRSESRTIDGVRFAFQLALNAESPSELIVYLPQLHVLDVAELATHTLHNLLPLRGAQVRDAKRWSQALNDALVDVGGDAQVIIDQHSWPVWGNERVRATLGRFRDVYKYIHDQTLRMMNEGMGPAEIAASLTAPPGLETDWSTRGYYGALGQDARAVYQRYVGWYDGNPANLNPLPRVEEARKYLEYMGGADAVIARARADFKAGNYRWVARVMNQVVFAEPSNTEARNLTADTFEQLGYLAESAPWRNAYLLAAQELRRPARVDGQRVPAISQQVLHAMPIADVFDYVGTRVNGPRAGTPRPVVINWTFTDTRESLTSTLEHGALTSTTRRMASDAGATVTTTRPVFEAVILGQRTLSDAFNAGEMTARGNVNAVRSLWALLVDFPPGFPLVAPAEDGRR
jgi:alkyl sulfatase BDS1-like metallo-beta-lactamase superfamily hydrolase